jgi:hypothetical protein
MCLPYLYLETLAICWRKSDTMQLTNTELENNAQTSKRAEIKGKCRECIYP